MKKIVKIEGLDCPNCARALQNNINNIEDVKDAQIDFVKCQLSFNSNEPEKALENIKKLTAKLEPQAKITEFNKKNDEKVKLNLILDIIFIVLGVSIGVIIFFVNMPVWAFWCLYTLSALMLGYKTYYKAIVLLFHGTINENLLITISVIGASFVSEHLEGLMVIALYSIGKIFEGLAVNKSRKSIELLTKIQPEYVNVLGENGEVKLTPEEVEKGAIIIVRPGEKIALDGIILDGECDLDAQSLTGESMPVHVKKGDSVLSGAISINGALKIQTTDTYKNSTISKILDLVEKASENKSKTETFISKLTKFYTLGIVCIAILVWGIVWIVTKNFDTALYRGLIFLVISCPCAFAISVPLAYFSGLGNASKRGVLIKGSNFLDMCAKLNVIAFDKTGTLTSGKFSIEKITSFDKNYDNEKLLEIACLGERYSIHPLAKAIVENAKVCPDKQIDNFKEISGKGVEFDFENNSYFVGRLDPNSKNTTVEIYKNKQKIGEIAFSDNIKPSAKETCQILNENGINTVLLSGDNAQSVENIAKMVGVNDFYSNLLPQDKYNLIQSFKDKNKRIGYVGDGINDAPSLTLADVGFCMGINGAPSSIEASDIVLVDDDPKKIISAIKISRNTKKIVLENIILSASIKVLFLILGSVGITGMLSAVFADVGVTLIAILNSIRALKFNPNKKLSINKK